VKRVWHGSAKGGQALERERAEPLDEATRVLKRLRRADLTFIVRFVTIFEAYAIIYFLIE
jgi:hypothetical protein